MNMHDVIFLKSYRLKLFRLFNTKFYFICVYGIKSKVIILPQSQP